ncbi:MAG: Ldh family oxidoreductase [Azospirillaceae bacterium]
MTVRIAATELAAFVTDLFQACGVPSIDARATADALVDADMAGIHSHGVMLAEMYVARLRAGSVTPAAAPRIVSDRGACIVIDAGNGLGVVTGQAAMDHAVRRAHELGVGVVAVRHGFHFGTAGRFAQAAARADCIGITLCNTRPLMPAPGGAERVVGNNPVAIAIPTGDGIPIVLDMATSEAAMGKIRVAAREGRAIPASWATDAQGMPTTDPTAAIEGMLLPSAGPKGFGLAFVIDLMCGLLSGGAIGGEVRPLYGDRSEPYDCSHFFLAIDLAHFGDPAVLRQRAADAARQVREGRRAPGTQALFTPGEPEWRHAAAQAGMIDLAGSVVSSLAETAEGLGVSQPPALRNERRNRA